MRARNLCRLLFQKTRVKRKLFIEDSEDEADEAQASKKTKASSPKSSVTKSTSIPFVHLIFSSDIFCQVVRRNPALHLCLGRTKMRKTGRFSRHSLLNLPSMRSLHLSHVRCLGRLAESRLYTHEFPSPEIFPSQ